MIFLQANGNFDSRLNFTQILDLLKSDYLFSEFM